MTSETEISPILSQALASHQAGNFADAEAGYRRLLESEPNNADALHLLGVLGLQMQRPEDAVALITRAVTIRPKNPNFLNNLGEAHRALGQNQEAAKYFKRAIKINPADPAPHNNLGNALAELGRAAEAEACYRRALGIESGDAEVLCNLGDVLKSQGKLEEAAASFRRAAAIDPQSLPALENLSQVVSLLGEQEEAVACYRKIAARKETDPVAHNNLAVAYFNQGDYAAAIDHHRRALEIDPGLATAAGDLLFALLYTCDWKEVEKLKPDVMALSDALVAKGERACIDPLLDVTLIDDPAKNLAVVKSWSADINKRMAGVAADFSFENRRREKSRLTVGYLSWDYHNHPTAHLMRSLFGLHDRDRLRVHGYSYGPKDDGPYRRAIAGSCDKFTDIRELDHAAAAKVIYDDEVDILVDLKGYTMGSRLEICALRPAPVQATYLGFPGTLGADFIDYNITDKIVTPEDHVAHYGEACVFMPHTYQVNDQTQEIAGTAPTRAACGLPEHGGGDGVVFSCFNKCNKYEPVMFEVWMNILKQTPGSVLWLYPANGLAQENLRAEARARGVEPDRLIFAGKLPKSEHLARLQLADLALDTLIYNGHTTTSDALWAGVPVVAMQGKHFASRVSASLLSAIGLADLITGGLEDYEALAVRLAKDGKERRALAGRLKENRRKAPLFDTERFARNLETAYAKMWETYISGAEPGHIHVEDENRACRE